MDVYLGTKYVLVDSENLEDYLKFLGVGYLARKVALTLKQTVSLTRNEDGSYKFEFSSPMVSAAAIFIPGEEFEELRPDGVQVTSTITLENNVMIHIQTDKNGRTSKHVREFYTENMITTTTAEGLDKTVKRYYIVQ